MIEALVRAFTENEARTDPLHADPRLRGRTYAISFERVWTAALELAGGWPGGLLGWKVLEADDGEGIILAEATTLVFRFVDDVRIDVILDRNAQTRVDVESRSRKGKGDLGANRRRIRRFFRKLDRRLEATSAEILDPTSSVPANREA